MSSSDRKDNIPQNVDRKDGAESTPKDEEYLKKIQAQIDCYLSLKAGSGPQKNFLQDKLRSYDPFDRDVIIQMLEKNIIAWDTELMYRKKLLEYAIEHQNSAVISKIKDIMKELPKKFDLYFRSTSVPFYEFLTQQCKINIPLKSLLQNVVTYGYTPETIDEIFKYIKDKPINLNNTFFVVSTYRLNDRCTLLDYFVVQGDLDQVKRLVNEFKNVDVNTDSCPPMTTRSLGSSGYKETAFSKLLGDIQDKIKNRDISAIQEKINIYCEIVKFLALKGLELTKDNIYELAEVQKQLDAINQELKVEGLPDQVRETFNTTKEYLELIASLHRAYDEGLQVRLRKQLLDSPSMGEVHNLFGGVFSSLTQIISNSEGSGSTPAPAPKSEEGSGSAPKSDDVTKKGPG